MRKKWMAIPALAGTILMGGVVLFNAANEITVTPKKFISTEHYHEQAIETIDFVYDFNIDAISGNVK